MHWLTDANELHSLARESSERDHGAVRNDLEEFFDAPETATDSQKIGKCGNEPIWQATSDGFYMRHYKEVKLSRRSLQPVATKRFLNKTILDETPDQTIVY